MRLLILFVFLLAAHTASAQPGPPHASVGERIRVAAGGWDGTNYRFGGTRTTGIDCSALMVSWFDHLFDIRLPRTSSQQFRVGDEVERDRLAEGDLVFFGSPSRITHVGVYVGRGEFAHAGASTGVTVSHMAQDYWANRYRGARRVLDGVRPETRIAERPALASEATARESGGSAGSVPSA